MDKELKPLADKLKKLPHALQDKVVVFATRKAAQKVAEGVRENAPVKTGFLRASIGVQKMRPSKVRNPAFVLYSVGIKKKAKWQSEVTQKRRRKSGESYTYKLESAYYGFWVDKGTKKMKAKPFLLPGLKDKESELLPEFKKEFAKKFERTVRAL